MNASARSTEPTLFPRGFGWPAGRLAPCQKNLTNDSVKFLGRCHTLNLSECKKLTDNSIKFLGNCHITIIYLINHNGINKIEYLFV